MAMRPVISYDDITAPGPSSTTQTNPQQSTAQGPPPKKRKVHGGRRTISTRNGQYPQHWDEPEESASQMTYDDGGGEGMTDADMDNAEEEGQEEEGQEEEGQEEEESRELTREEVWDDSALVDAWNSAMAEYEAYHGKGKWKEEPVKKSPLWYNIPPAKPDEKSKGKEKASAGTSITRPVLPNGVTYAYQEVEDDSATHDLEANVPVHDPSFSGANVVPRSDDAAYALSEPGAMVSQDEAFSRALNASYWSGYWTAAYHYHRAGGKRGNAEEEVGEGEDAGDGEQEDELLPAQR